MGAPLIGIHFNTVTGDVQITFCHIVMKENDVVVVEGLDNDVAVCPGFYRYIQYKEMRPVSCHY